ncbi:hypothetical protein D3C73_1427450 [compost metagenome]
MLQEVGNKLLSNLLRVISPAAAFLKRCDSVRRYATGDNPLKSAPTDPLRDIESKTVAGDEPSARLAFVKFNANRTDLLIADPNAGILRFTGSFNSLGSQIIDNH